MVCLSPMPHSSQPQCLYTSPAPSGLGRASSSQVKYLFLALPSHTAFFPTRPFSLLTKQNQEQESHQEAFLKTGCLHEYTCEGAKPQVACDHRQHAYKRPYLWAQISKPLQGLSLNTAFVHVTLQGTLAIF